MNMKINHSIHPRVLGGKTWFKKENTARQPNPATKQRVIKGITEHLERHPRDEASRKHLEKLKP